MPVDKIRATESPNKHIEFVTPSNAAPTVYANNISFGVTGFDVRILFGEVMGLVGEAVQVQPKVQVTLSWLEAKVLYKFLEANIAMYEERNGPIKPPNIELQVPDFAMGE